MSWSLSARCGVVTAHRLAATHVPSSVLLSSAVRGAKDVGKGKEKAGGDKTAKTASAGGKFAKERKVVELDSTKRSEVLRSVDVLNVDKSILTHLSKPLPEVGFEELRSITIDRFESKLAFPRSWLFELLRKVSNKEELRLALLLIKRYQLWRDVVPGDLATDLIKACVRINDPVQALEELRDNQGLRTFPEPSTYIRLIDAFIKRKEAANAWGVLDLMRAKQTQLTPLTMRHMVTGFLSTSMPDQAFRVAALAHKSALPLMRTTLNELLGAVISEKSAEQLAIVEKLLEKQQQQKSQQKPNATTIALHMLARVLLANQSPADAQLQVQRAVAAHELPLLDILKRAVATSKKHGGAAKEQLADVVSSFAASIPEPELATLRADLQ